MSDISDVIRIGSGAGYSGDRIDPAIELVEKGNLDFLVFECLAERTIALAQLRRSRDPQSGFDPLLEERMRACLPGCASRGIRIISNMGAANPQAALAKTKAIAQSLGIKNLSLAAITGDEVSALLAGGEYTLLETGAPLDSIRDRIISANAYLGMEPIVEALDQGAHIVLTGRVADPALFLAPAVHAFRWDRQNYRLMGQGIVMGHLLECAGQVSGGYFADPGYKDVSGLDHLGFPFAEVLREGTFSVRKVDGSGGRIDQATCTEQLLYEIHDPARYPTPDVIADFSGVSLTEEGSDCVTVRGGKGHPPSGQLKVSIGYRDGYQGEGQISYGGVNAVARGQLASEILQKRFARWQIPAEDLRFDLIGLNALYGKGTESVAPAEVRLRVTVRTMSPSIAAQVGREVEALYTNGPAGGGGAIAQVREIVAIQSVLIPAELVKPQIHLEKI